MLFKSFCTLFFMAVFRYSNFPISSLLVLCSKLFSSSSKLILFFICFTDAIIDFISKSCTATLCSKFSLATIYLSNYSTNAKAHSSQLWASWPCPWQPVHRDTVCFLFPFLALRTAAQSMYYVCAQTQWKLLTTTQSWAEKIDQYLITPSFWQKMFQSSLVRNEVHCIITDLCVPRDDAARRFHHTTYS